MVSKITIRLWNDDSTDSIDYEGDTLKEIQEKAKERILFPTWQNGWSEVIKGSEYLNEL